MNIHEARSRTSMRALSLFLKECALDRTRENRPLRDLVYAEEISTFQEGLERLVGALLRDYSLEKRAALLERAVERRARRLALH